jgi:hypothetical protein
MREVLQAQINKTDRNDACGMAQMMRAGLYRRPSSHENGSSPLTDSIPSTLMCLSPCSLSVASWLAVGA